MTKAEFDTFLRPVTRPAPQSDLKGIEDRRIWISLIIPEDVLVGKSDPGHRHWEFGWPSVQGYLTNHPAHVLALALPWPAELSAGRNRIHGYAHSPAGPISRVEWSEDYGRTWNEAELSGRQPDLSWARFELAWNAEPGERIIMTRATDTVGNSQPDHVPFNEKGYLFNQPLPHHIRVT